MRQPTKDDRAWWRAALAGERPAITGEPQCGFFKRRLVKGGCFVPVHIWIEQVTDPETGELMQDVEISCSVDGRIANVDDNWMYVCDQPISEAEFDYMVKLSAYARAHDKKEPAANPRRPIDPLKFRLPTFTTKQRKSKK